MAKIKTEKFYFNRVPFIREIHCDSKGVFTSRLPTEVAKLLDKEKVEGKTITECEQEWDRAIEGFKSAQSVKRKVIYYELQLSAYILRDGKCVLHRDNEPFARGMSLQLEAGVYIEEKITMPGGSIRYEYHREESTIPGSLSAGRRSGPKSYDGKPDKDCIDWTERREAFFAKVGTSMEQLIITLDGAFMDRESVTKLADSGRPLLQ